MNSLILEVLQKKGYFQKDLQISTDNGILPISQVIADVMTALEPKWLGIEIPEKDIKVCVGFSDEDGMDLSWHDGKSLAWRMDGITATLTDADRVFDDNNKLIP